MRERKWDRIGKYIVNKEGMSDATKVLGLLPVQKNIFDPCQPSNVITFCIDRIFYSPAVWCKKIDLCCTLVYCCLLFL